MLGITKKGVYLAEGGEAASCRGADETKFLSIKFDHSFGGRKTMFSEHEVEVQEKLDD